MPRQVVVVVLTRGKQVQAVLDAFQTYVVLKVQNLKGTTIDRRGSEPCWEQDFMFEICADGKGFIIELWKKGLLWDSILGVLWIPLATVEHATEEGPGTWWTLHSEVIKNGSEIQGTKKPTSHEVLLDVYFALPFGFGVMISFIWSKTVPRKLDWRNISYWLGGNKDQVDGSNFAKARWARAIQKTLQEAMRNRVKFCKTYKTPSGFGFKQADV
ncbi:hypothetical protein llap_1725 [Limosa lapponica baueri]|uniref:C2 domain-containing protein n=1 Tax=Limosa lapponica baueri TaxID=1758121 RepID=A0A2I0UPG7_LIMLA|nr:hypothetical protein llap_1725 [Limosa lapponica baueri]